MYNNIEKLVVDVAYDVQSFLMSDDTVSNIRSLIAVLETSNVPCKSKLIQISKEMINLVELVMYYEETDTRQIADALKSARKTCSELTSIFYEVVNE